MNKPHWFPFCPNDFLSSSKVAIMSTEEIGAYVLLLCHAWNDPDCSLPDDDKMLQKLGRFSGDMETIRACFELIDGRLVNERLLKEAKKTKSIQRLRSKSGKEGAAKRWHSKCHALAIANDQQNDAQLQSQSQLHIHKEEEKKEQSLASPKREKLPRVLVSDEDWVAGLKQDPLYAGIDIDLEVRKSSAWYQEHRRKWTRKAFTNWLIRAMGDKPMAALPKKRILLT